LAPESVHAARHAGSGEYQLEVLERLAEEPGPKFVVAHVLLPHDPYVFLEDGRYAPLEATYESQLHYTNDRLLAWLEPLLTLPEEERPIIILQADEGPYPERYAAQQDAFDWKLATEAEVMEKFGILTAMYLPGDPGMAPLPATLSPVNTFREVLRRYFGAELPNLPDRSYASSAARPYDLIELTHRLPTPNAAPVESLRP
jgi:hypothetical protein